MGACSTHRASTLDAEVVVGAEGRASLVSRKRLPLERLRVTNTVPLVAQVRLVTIVVLLLGMIAVVGTRTALMVPNPSVVSADSTMSTRHVVNQILQTMRQQRDKAR